MIGVCIYFDCVFLAIIMAPKKDAKGGGSKDKGGKSAKGGGADDKGSFIAVQQYSLAIIFDIYILPRL